MPRSPRPWILTRRDPIEKLEDNLWAVQGDVPGIPFKRRMFVIKRSDGTRVARIEKAMPAILEGRGFLERL